MRTGKRPSCMLDKALAVVNAIADASVADPETLWARIRELRSTGYSIACGELEPETAAVAVPVYGDRGEVVASLSVAGPESQFRAEDPDSLVQLVSDCARRISQEVGYERK